MFPTLKLAKMSKSENLDFLIVVADDKSVVKYKSFIEAISNFTGLPHHMIDFYEPSRKTSISRLKDLVNRNNEFRKKGFESSVLIILPNYSEVVDILTEKSVPDGMFFCNSDIKQSPPFHSRYIWNIPFPKDTFYDNTTEPKSNGTKRKRDGDVHEQKKKSSLTTPVETGRSEQLSCTDNEVKTYDANKFGIVNVHKMYFSSEDNYIDSKFMFSKYCRKLGRDINIYEHSKIRTDKGDVSVPSTFIKNFGSNLYVPNGTVFASPMPKLSIGNNKYIIDVIIYGELVFHFNKITKVMYEA